MILAAASASTNPLGTWAIVGGILSPFLAIGAAVLASVFSRRTGREQNQTSERAVQVDEKEAHTAEIAMIIDGFSASLKQAQADLGGARTELREARDELAHALQDNAALRRRVVGYGKQLREMLFHILALELLVPNPPGPPSRPDWDPWPDDFEDTENPNDPRRST
ncbi:hypothetical protein Q9R08_05255 [Microbacterium sp. QXD-8]|uniref:Uncharacterized protein n=1 Tax=Microbacterium psychrotolerans TaxID=3068321 RepID=A0ABU0Z1H2_9MICO|nr:hypothetical protein [Microbacterium sp. QXD-8]